MMANTIVKSKYIVVATYKQQVLGPIPSPATKKINT